MPPLRFLVTGCAGFIGSHMTDRLLALGHEVTGIDNLATGNRENLRAAENDFPHAFRFLEADLRDADAAAEAVKNADRVIHLASVPSVPRSVGNPLESAENSIIATVTLLDAAHKAGIKRVVQSTSSSAYGETETLPKTETMPPAPRSPYAAAKLAQEYYGAAFTRCHGLDTAALRFFNVFGPRQNPESAYAAAIPKFIRRMLSGLPPQIHGDGAQTRDFTYVENAVDACIAAATAPAPLCGEVANIGCGGETSLNALVAELNTILGTRLAPEYLPPRPGDILRSRADIAKANALFGYTPRVSVAEGLQKTAEWLKSGESRT